MGLLTTIKRVAFAATAATLIAFSFGSLQAVQPTDVNSNRLKAGEHARELQFS